MAFIAFTVRFLFNGSEVLPEGNEKRLSLEEFTHKVKALTPKDFIAECEPQGQLGETKRAREKTKVAGQF